MPSKNFEILKYSKELVLRIVNLKQVKTKTMFQNTNLVNYKSIIEYKNCVAWKESLVRDLA